MPHPELIRLFGCEAQALIDALKAYGPSRMGNHTLYAALLAKLQNEREYGYEDLGFYSRDLSAHVDAAHRGLRALSNSFQSPFTAHAEDDAKPLLDELGKIIDALDQSNGTDPQSVFEGDGIDD